MNRISFACLLLLIFLLLGCQMRHTITTPATEEQVYSPVSPDRVAVYATANAPYRYTVIGELVAMADAGQDADVPVNLLREEAANIGADAIVNLRLSFGAGFWLSGIKATATAVKYND